MPKTVIKGLADMRRRSTAALRLMESKLKAANRKTAEAIQADARELAAVESGHMRDSIHIREDEDGSFIVGLWSEDFPEFFYPAIVEHGRADMAPQPFMAPAFELHASQASLKYPFLFRVD